MNRGAMEEEWQNRFAALGFCPTVGMRVVQG